MPKVRRSRVVAADRGSVWALISDPYHRARWWPKVSRVEDVDDDLPRPGAGWVDVLETASGKGVRAQLRSVRSRPPEELAWEQQIEGTPFAKVLKSSVTSVALEEGDAGTRVTIEADQRLRGLSRLGGFMLRRATATQLDEALSGLEGALGAKGAGA